MQATCPDSRPASKGAQDVYKRQGLPAEKQPYFDLLNDNILTARIQVEAAILPEETREWIPAGT